MPSTDKTTTNVGSLSTAETPQNQTPSFNTSSTSDITLLPFPATLLIVAIALPGVLIFIINLVCVLLVATCCMFVNMKRNSMASGKLVYTDIWWFVEEVKFKHPPGTICKYS